MRLSVTGRSRDGNSRVPALVRWTSLDSSVAVTTVDGLLIPRANGIARVVASAGGWRADTTRVVVARRAATLSSRTTWTADSSLAPWFVFGTPQPARRVWQGRQVLSLNGDSSYTSGIRLRRSYRVHNGLALRVRARIAVTANQWQNVNVDLQAAVPDSVWEAWDKSTGAEPQSGNTSLSCAIGFPGGEGSDARTRLSVSAAFFSSNSLAAPTRLLEGRWVWLEVQLLPDGRCGMAVDGTPMQLTQDRQPVGRMVEVRIHGYSHRTLTLVDTVETYEGVLHPEWWSALEALRMQAESDGAAPNVATAPRAGPTASPAPGRSSRPSAAGAARGRAALPAAVPPA